MTYSLAVDIGGTFTDIVLRHPDGQLTIDKTLTTHGDLIEGFMRGVESVLAKAGIGREAVDGLIVHATTVVTNALIERKGVPTALILTEGFTDILSIRNENRYDVYDTQIEFPEPLIPRDRIFGVDERMLANGDILRGPDRQLVQKLAQELKVRGIVSVGICFINAFANPISERSVAEWLAAELPGLQICLSSDVAPVIREYTRTSTTAVNAYTVPIARPYLARLSATLQTAGFRQSPLMMLSSGGVVGADTAGRFPVRMIESGPAAGALAASHYGQLLGLDRLMSFDMGGTTAKACLIEDGAPHVTGLFEVDRRYRFKEGSGLPITVPSIDMIEIGAGGGSIARVDAMGLLKVGPDSAGSEPGPACYGRGGTNATVTDANLVLGLLDPNNFLGGEMILDIEATRAAIERVASDANLSVEATARGIFRVVTETMASSARTHAADRGVDYRGLPLFAFGGGGAIHGCAVAELLEGRMVIVPPKSSVLSAVGTLVTPARLDVMQSDLVRLDDLDWDRASRTLNQLQFEAVRALGEAGCNADQIAFQYKADLRYSGQQYELSIELDFDPRRERDSAQLKRIFEAQYEALYGLNPSNVAVELVTWRLIARANLGARDLKETVAAVAGLPKGKRVVHAWADPVEAAVYDRVALAHLQRITGPAIIEERETTTIIPPGWTAEVDRLGCIVATKESPKA